MSRPADSKPLVPGRKGAWDPLSPLESKAIQHSAYLYRLVMYDGGRRPVLPLSAEFLLEVSSCLRELVHAGRAA